MEKLQQLISVSDHQYEPIPDPEILKSISVDSDEEHERRRHERDSKLLDFYEQRKSRLLKLAVPVLIVVLVFVSTLAMSNSSWVNPYYSNPYGGNDAGSNENTYHITRSSKDTGIEVENAAGSTGITNTDGSSSSSSVGIMGAVKSAALVCGVSCPDNIVQDSCSNTDHPVMGGLDMVQYFSFPDESYTGEVGSPDYQVQYLVTPSRPPFTSHTLASHMHASL